MASYRNNRGGKNGNRIVKDYSNEWLQTLQLATSCLRNPNATMDDLDVSVKFLNTLESILLTKENKWHRPPNELPPQWENTSNHRNKPSHSSYPGNGIAVVSPIITPPSNRSASSNNRYASIQDDDDSDEDGSHFDDIEDEAGDQIAFHNGGTGTPQSPYIQGMDMRRIMIRILNLQSDVFAAQALIFRKQQPPNWTLGAQQYTYCLHKIHSALILADSEISKWLSSLSQDSMMYHKVVQLLTEDANIVEVSVHSMTSNRDTFLAAVRRVEAALLQKLQPQWQSRDEVKERMGKQRWYSNPNPKFDYAQLRVDYEKQLKDIRSAVLCLEALDTTTIVESTKHLRDRLRGGGHYPNGEFSPVSMPVVNTPEPNVESNLGQRYNGMRPRDVSRRVDYNLYPDPTHFGWIFTGSSGVTEFFEKDGVKLDWYFTTATIKTSLDHPTQGRTQLFASRVDPETYRVVLENPRAHTGKRYQRRAGKPRHN